MRPYIFKIPAGGFDQPSVVGNYVRLASISGATSLVVKCLETGEEVELEAGDDAKLSEFKRLQLSHSAAGEVTAKLYVGLNTEASSSKVGGAVSIVDDGLARTLGLSSIIGGDGMTASAGNYSSLQLWVRPESTKKIIVQRVLASAAVACDLGISRSSVALANITGSMNYKDFSTAVAPSNIDIRYEASAAPKAGYFVQVGAGVPVEFGFTDPIVLVPGTGLIVGSQVVNVGINSLFEGYLEDA